MGTSHNDKSSLNMLIFLNFFFKKIVEGESVFSFVNLQISLLVQLSIKRILILFAIELGVGPLIKIIPAGEALPPSNALKSDRSRLN